MNDIQFLKFQQKWNWKWLLLQHIWWELPLILVQKLKSSVHRMVSFCSFFAFVYSYGVVRLDAVVTQNAIMFKIDNLQVWHTKTVWAIWYLLFFFFLFFGLSYYVVLYKFPLSQLICTNVITIQLGRSEIFQGYIQ